MLRCLVLPLLMLLIAAQTVVAEESAGKVVSKRFTTKLVEPLSLGDERIEVTEAGTLRRRYRAWGDYSQEAAVWKANADRLTGGAPPKRTFRLACIFLDDAVITCPDLMGTDGKPLTATYTTPAAFREKMPRVAREYEEFTYAFTRGELKCEWVFDSLSGVHWTAPGKKPTWSCQPRMSAEQIEPLLAKYQDAQIDMWIFCCGLPTTMNGTKELKIGGPPFAGMSYTQWQLLQGYSVALTTPTLGVIVHEVNHRYLDNLNSIEGIQLTLFHGLDALGYENGDLGFTDGLLSTYRAVYLFNIRPAMWRRFSLVGPHGAKPEPYAGKFYSWKDVSDDAWFRLPCLTVAQLAELTGLPSLKIEGERRAIWRHFTVDDADQAKLESPYVDQPSTDNVTPNNLLSLCTESAAVLKTPTGHWLIVRPEVVEAYDQMRVAQGGKPLEVAGWINENVCPLVVLRAPNELSVPEREIDYFR